MKNKTMKVIDLLVDIANFKEVPQYIEYYDRIANKRDKMLVCKENIIYKLDQENILLNDEVEILEDKLEKIEQLSIAKKIKQNYGKDYSLTHQEFFIQDKINEVIDKLNYLLEKSDKDE